MTLDAELRGHTHTSRLDSWQRVCLVCVPYLVFLEHDVGVYQSLLEVAELVGQVEQRVAHAVCHGHLVLVQNGELVKQRRNLGLDRRQLGVELFPQQQTFTELIQRLRKLRHSTDVIKVCVACILKQNLLKYIVYYLKITVYLRRVLCCS